MKIRYALLATLTAGVISCDSVPTVPNEVGTAIIAKRTSDVVYTSGSDVQTWDPILPAAADPNWPTSVCKATPDVGPNANWQSPHNSFVTTGHPWANLYFNAPWINSWSGNTSVGPAGHNWTKYQTTVAGNGTFVIRLLADNCSWVYLDGTLVGVQPANHNATNTSYGLALNGTHTLVFIIFDGGGAAGGKFILEATSTPPPPLDSDGDTYPNTTDAFPFDPTEWADTDGDGVGDNKDKFPTNPGESKDTDNDGRGDNGDNCPTVANSDQADLDGDGKGDACDPDIDGDGVGNAEDAYPLDPTRSTFDIDGDGVVDGSDNCPAVPNPAQEDLDADGQGDVCDTDIDGDGVPNGSDVYPTNPAESADSDGDGIGNNADPYDNSNTGPALMVGSCNTGVANWNMGGGTWANDLIVAAYASAANHGKFVKAVETLADGWKKSGRISGAQHGAIVSCAARTK